MRNIITYICFIASMFVNPCTVKAQDLALIAAAEFGRADAQTKLGSYYANVKKDYEKANYWWQKAADQNEPHAQYYLGVSSYNNANIEKAMYWWQKAAEQGIAIAQRELGECYANVKKDYEKANYWWQKAAKQNDPIAQHYLGITCKRNENEEGAIYWFKKAGEQGVLDSQKELGEYYFRLKQFDQAKYWWQKAVTQNDRYSLCNLGITLHKMGETKEAMKFLKQAMKQGIPNAYHYLGTMYYNGDQIEKNYQAAVSCFEIVLKNQTVPDGIRGDICHKLSACYRFGRGVEANERKADEYLKQAALLGVTDAIKTQEELLE